MNLTVDLLISFFLIIGAFLSLVAAFGVIRLPDVYTRNHAASKSSTLGVMSILLGCFLYFYLVEGHFSSRVLLGFIFLFMTAPVAAHLISRAAYNSGVGLSKESIRDDLKNKPQKSK